MELIFIVYNDIVRISLVNSNLDKNLILVLFFFTTLSRI